MKTYYTNEVRFVIPARTVDRTVNAFIVPAGGPLDPVDPDEKGEFSLVITRAPMTADDTLPAYVTRQVAAVREMLPEFRLLSRHPASIDNLPAEQVDFTWRSEDALMRQQQTHFRHGDLVVSVTGTALDALYAKHRPVLEQALLTMKLNT